MSSRYEISAIFRGVDKITAPVSRMQNSVLKFTRKTTKGLKTLDRGVNRFTSGFKRAAIATAVGVTLVSAALTNVIGSGANFEQAITDVGAVSLKTRNQIKALENQALMLGATTKFTATEAAMAMQILARSGLSESNILTATPSVLNAAAASGLEMAQTADYVIKAVKGMGLEFKDASYVADLLTVASTKTNSTIGSIAESLSLVTSTARKFKIPIKDVVGSIALLQDVGLQASVAGSALNTALTKMAAPTVSMQKKMKRLGISFKDAQGDMLPFTKVLEQLVIAGKKSNGNLNEVAFFAELVGLRGQKAAVNLADLFKSGRYSELGEYLEDVSGKAKEMADIKMNTTIGSWTLLKSVVEGVKIQMFGMTEGPLKDMIDKTREWVVANKDLIAIKAGEYIKKIVENAPLILKTAIVLLKVAAAVTGLIIVLKALILVLTVVNLLMAANPVVLLILGIVTAIAVITTLISLMWKYRDAITSFIKKHAEWIAVLSLALGPIGFLIGAAAMIIKYWTPIKNFFTGIFDAIKKSFNDMVDFKIEKSKKLISSLKDIFGKIPDIIGKIGGFFNFGLTQDEQSSGSGVQMITPQERIARSIEEKRSLSAMEMTIKDETGRAEITGGSIPGGMELIRSGAF